MHQLQDGLAKDSGRCRRQGSLAWHDNRHTFITGLAESGEASDQTIMDIAGHVSNLSEC